MSDFDLRRLRYFIAVAELGSVTRAAKELYIAQPALSKHIRQLEEQVGRELFSRSAQGVQLTSVGMRLLDHARRTLAEMDRLLQELQDSSQIGPEGTVVIGMAPTIGAILAGSLVEAQSTALPLVRLQIRETMSRDIPDLIRGGAIDYALSYDIASQRGVRSAGVFTEDSYLYGSWTQARRLRLERDKDIPFDTLAKIPLLLSGPANAFRGKIEQTALARRFRLDIVAEVDSLAIRRDLASKGLAFTILSGTTIRRPHDRDVYAARIVRPRIRRQICYVTPEGPTRSRAALSVAELIDGLLRTILGGSGWAGAQRLRKASLISLR
jgi:LysR family nitrogen assimilation transcriptional regulator